MNRRIVVHKLDERGGEVWSYEGRLIERRDASLRIEAEFDHDDVEFYGLTLRRGDRFVETYYADRWYNVYAIHDVDDGRLKGWYCNLARPARFQGDHIYAEDLALDLIVFPDGGRRLLDEDEFAALNLTHEEKAQVHEALVELEALIDARQGPFSPPADEAMTNSGP